MESAMAIFGVGFLGGFVTSGWLAFFAWRRPRRPVEGHSAGEAVLVSPPTHEEPEATQRLDTKEISALLAHANQGVGHPASVGTVAPKRVSTPNRKVPALRPSIAPENTTPNAKKEGKEEGDILLDLTGL